MEKVTVYISSYPKSGSTWVTRLLGDVLNSPTGGSMPQEDSKEIATEGQNRSGNYIVRKGHFVLVDNDTGSVVPSPHRLAWKRLTNERIVFLVRDPRDICVSGAWHWQQSVESFLDRMIKGDIARCDRWDIYCDNHLKLVRNGTSFLVTYEELLSNPDNQLRNILAYLGHDYNPAIAQEAIKRNTFNHRKALIGNDPQALRRNNMRKGISGDWHNHFTPQMNDKIWQEFGWMMERLGYANEF